MRIQAGLLAVVVQCASAVAGRAGVIFSQDFSSAPNGPVSSYVATPANSQQFNTINWTGLTGGIVNGALSYSRDGTGWGWFARTTDFTPVPNAMIYSFDLSVSG